MEFKGRSMYGESPAESALAEVRETTLAEQRHKRRIWEEAFHKYVRGMLEPWQRKMIQRMRFIRVAGNWPLTDLPDGSEC